jgi:membrane protease YdiL (CAAX protease family)
LKFNLRPEPRPLSFDKACLAELVFLAVAFFWGALSQHPTLGDLRWRTQDALLGCAAVIPPFVFFLWTLKSELPVISRHRKVLEALLRPLFGSWSLPQLAVLCVAAGFAEEALFRGALQRTCARGLGNLPAIIIASLLFGAAHPLTLTYGLITGAIGAYLGWLWLFTGNLLTPMVTHAAYDFAVLVYFLRFHRPAKGEGR